MAASSARRCKVSVLVSANALTKTDTLEQLAKWFDEEREAFKAKGAKGEILEEAAFLEIVLDAVMAKHLAEIRSDPEFWAAILEEASI
jgi:lipoate-protein ligase A